MKLRVNNELLSLFFSIAILLFVSYVFLEISFLFLAFLILIQLIYIFAVSKQFLGNSILVTNKQFQNIFKIVEESSKKLGVSKPNVFIQQDPYLNAFAIGFKKPYSIVLSSSLVESLSVEELKFVIAHEIGHIKLGHVRWLSFVSPLGRNNPFLTFIYGHWQRLSEYSADRCGLFVSESIPKTIGALIKISVGKKLSEEIDKSDIIRQIEKENKTTFSSFGEWFLTHPYILNRIEELVSFYEFEMSEEKK